MTDKENGKTALLKLDLGCGENKKEGFTGVDFYADTDVKADLMKFPWIWEDQSVEEIWCSHFFEHIPGPTRVPFMDEVWRIMIPNGKMTIICPYWSSPRSIQDPMHCWPPICDETFLYFNKGWRTANRLNHYLGKCDFDFSTGYMVDQETAQKAQEVQYFHMKHYLRTINDIQVTLTRRP